MKLEQEIVIAAKSGLAFPLNQHQVLRVIDLAGKQVADLIAYQQDLTEKLSTGVTIEQNGSLKIEKGNHLFSNQYNQMLTVIEDTVGKHDLLFPACSPAMYKAQYKFNEYHPSCSVNLEKAVTKYGVKEEIPTPFNIFMNTNTAANGKITVDESLSKAGDFIELRAEMDLIIAISACPVEESKCNGYQCTPIKVQVYS